MIPQADRNHHVPHHRGQDLDAHRHAGLAPRATTGRALNAERILARRQSCVGRLAAITADFDPIRFQGLQLVSIAVRRRIAVAQRREAEREDVVFGRENQITGVRDGPLKREMASPLCRIPPQPEVG